ncbi:MAG: class I SAM-dependent methyltransferase [Ilumatobacteraceae bacterium]
MSSSAFETDIQQVDQSLERIAAGIDDPYGEATAEFYDLLATAMWDELGPSLPFLLSGLDPAAGPILDLGAGTGAGTVHIHAAFPDASIVALEPSKAMRTALNARLAIDPGLRSAVTVVPLAFDEADLPARLSGVVASAVIGHFDEPARRALWRSLAARLAPGAPALIGVLPPTRPEPVALTRYRSLPVGEFVYEGWMEGEPVDDRRMLWTMTYRVLVGDDVIYSRQAPSLWHTCGADDVAAEVASLGLVVERPDPDHVVLRRK